MIIVTTEVPAIIAAATITTCERNMTYGTYAPPSIYYPRNGQTGDTNPKLVVTPKFVKNVITNID